MSHRSGRLSDVPLSARSLARKDFTTQLSTPSHNTGHGTGAKRILQRNSRERILIRTPSHDTRHGTGRARKEFGGAKNFASVGPAACCLFCRLFSSSNILPHPPAPPDGSDFRQCCWQTLRLHTCFLAHPVSVPFRVSLSTLSFPL